MVSSGSNQLAHQKSCDKAWDKKEGAKKPKQTKLTDNIPRKFRKGKFRLKLLKWVTRMHRPFSIIEDADLLDVFIYLNPQAQPPSRHTLRRDIHHAYKLTRAEVRSMLEEYEGRFNPIFDCWTASNGHEFLGVLVSFIHKGRMVVIALDMIE